MLAFVHSRNDARRVSITMWHTGIPRSEITRLRKNWNDKSRNETFSSMDRPLSLFCNGACSTSQLTSTGRISAEKLASEERRNLFFVGNARRAWCFFFWKEGSWNSCIVNRRMRIRGWYITPLFSQLYLYTHANNRFLRFLRDVT